MIFDVIRLPIFEPNTARMQYALGVQVVFVRRRTMPLVHTVMLEQDRLDSHLNGIACDGGYVAINPDQIRSDSVSAAQTCNLLIRQTEPAIANVQRHNQANLKASAVIAG